MTGLFMCKTGTHQQQYHYKHVRIHLAVTGSAEYNGLQQQHKTPAEVA